MYKRLIIIIAVGLLVVGCTDADFGKFASLGSSATVQCWSGDTVIYEGTSSGKVQSEQNSDGYFFKDNNTGKMMEVSGNCVITYKGNK